MDSLCDDAATALHTAHSVSVDTLIKLFDKGADLKKVKTLLENTYTGVWSPGRLGSSAANFEYHYEKHVINRFEWNEIITKDEYKQKAIDLINRRSGVEVYYQKGIDNIAVYDRTANEFTTGNELGEIQTFFVPKLIDKDSTQVNYVDNLISEGKLIKLR
jgi:hypothetical protein